MGQPENNANALRVAVAAQTEAVEHQINWRLTKRCRWLVRIGYLLVIFGLLVVFLKYPPPSTATVRVGNPQGQPLPGATAYVQVVKTVSNRICGEWDGRAELSKHPWVADEEGLVTFQYPQVTPECEEVAAVYLEVRQKGFSILHEWTVLNRRPINAGAWAQIQFQLSDLWDDLLGHRKVRRLTMQTAVTVEITAKLNGLKVDPAQLLPVMSDPPVTDRLKCWSVFGDGVLSCSQVSLQNPGFYLAYHSDRGKLYYSNYQGQISGSGTTKQFDLALRPGFRVEGALADEVPRPVKNGRIYAWSCGVVSAWQAWTPTDEEGNFVFESLPFPHVEMTGVCEGYVSASEQGVSRHSYNAQGRAAVLQEGKRILKMVPEACVEVMVLDPAGNPVQGATVRFRAVVTYSGGSTLFPGDKWNMEDALDEGGLKQMTRDRDIRMAGRTGPSGRVTIRGLPGVKQSFFVEHPDFVMSFRMVGTNRIQWVSMDLKAGETNKVTVTLEKKP